MNHDQVSPSANQNRIKGLRMERGLRAIDVAAKTGLSVAQVYRLEAGQRPNVAAVTLARVALALDTMVEYLMGLTDDARSIYQLTGRCSNAIDLLVYLVIVLLAS